MNAALGWALAVAAVAVGYGAYGWPGVFLAISVIAFWLLLQFSRALRALRLAGSNPVGSVANAVMFNARLQKGMRLPDVLKLTKSLGRRIGESETPEVWAWADAGSDEVQVQLQGGSVTGWQLIRGNQSQATAA
jgi:uncharacterized protein (DUF58 family)